MPADKFGEQTHIMRGKGSRDMKGISTSPEQVAVWVNSFSVCANLVIITEHMYNEAGEEQKSHCEVDGEEKNKHKEKGGEEKDWMKPIGRRSRWRWRSAVTPNDQQPGVYNICNGQVAPDSVNVQNTLATRSEQYRQFSASLSKTIKKKVKTLELLKKMVTVKGKAIYDIETLFSSSRGAATQH